MTTVGNLFDSLSILEKRMSVVKESNDEELIKELYMQKGWIIKELSRVLSAIVAWDRPAQFKKNKLYNQDINIQESDSLLNVIAQLNEYNCKLWSCEDDRRDKRLTDAQRLEAADQIAVYNKLRNDSIDSIDKIINDVLSISMYY